MESVNRTTKKNNGKWMIYGANGFTGKLIAELAKKKNLNPILAGRSKVKIEPLAQKLGFEYRIFDLNNPTEIDRALEDINAVIHCAGPFQLTATQMVNACIRNLTHYLDITGEFQVIDSILKRSVEAEKANIVLIPGVGLDIVPTDCIALMLKEKLPTAEYLQLGLITGNSASSIGTINTIILSLGEPNYVRKNNELISVPLFHKNFEITVNNRTVHVGSVPWGDIGSANYSTGIGNVETYLSVPEKAVPWVKGYFFSAINYITSFSATKYLLQTLASFFVKGPTEQQQQNARVTAWGRVWDAEGKGLLASLTLPEGYVFTADSAIAIVLEVLSKNMRGAKTPSVALGSNFVCKLNNVQMGTFEEFTVPKNNQLFVM